MIKLILFDLGGVVVKLPEHKYFEYLSDINNVSPYLAERVLISSAALLESGKIRLYEFQRAMGKEFGIPSNKISWLSFFKKNASLDWRTVEIVKDLKRNYKIAFLSNIDKGRYDYMLKHILNRVLYLFDYKFASFKLGIVKPSPLVYKKVLKAMHLRPSEVIFIDNNLDNVLGARSVGIKSLQFTNARKLRLDLKKFGIKLKSV